MVSVYVCQGFKKQRCLRECQVRAAGELLDRTKFGTLTVTEQTYELRRVNKYGHVFFRGFCPDGFSLLHHQEALIHLGAKFSPCMRQDQEVHDQIQKKREVERNSACCVRNDRSGCLQTSEEECSVSSNSLQCLKHS